VLNRALRVTLTEALMKLWQALKLAGESDGDADESSSWRNSASL